MKLCQRRNLCCLSIILPLAKKGKEVKQKVIEQVVDLAKQIEDENTQAFVILVFW